MLRKGPGAGPDRGTLDHGAHTGTPGWRPHRRLAGGRAVVRVLVLAATVALGAAGCGGDAPAGRKIAGREGAPRRGGTLVIAAPGDLQATNPMLTDEAYTQEVARFLLYTTLLRYGPDLDYQPYLARSWDMAGDTAVVFHLRDDVRWTDGQPTTAYDVAFTYGLAKDPATAFPNSGYFEHWRTAQVIDSFTVRFTLDRQAEPLAGWTSLPILPRHLLDTVPPERLRTAQYNRAPVGNGPFRFVSHLANDRWVFEANPAFPVGLGGRPYLDRVVWRVVPDRQAQLAELLTGNADLILSAPAERFAQLSAEPGLTGVMRPSLKYAFIGWNGKRAPFNDARVRRALALAIDRSAILQTLRAGYGELATGPVHSLHWAYDASLAPLPYDTAAARALLGGAGYFDRNDDGALEDEHGEPFAFELKVPAGVDFSLKMGQMIVANLAAIGVRATLRPLEFNTLIGDIASPERRFDAVLMGLEGELKLDLRDLFSSPALGGPFQLASYSNPEVDRLLAAAAVEPDRSVTRPEWRRVQEILREDQPWTFLYYYPDLVLMRSRVHGVTMDLRGLFATLPSWWIGASAEQLASANPAPATR